MKTQICWMLLVGHCCCLCPHRFTPGKGLVIYPQIGDKMDIVCPRADPSEGGKEEFYRVYLVSRSQMENCSIDTTDTPLLNCNKPDRDVKFTFKFQEFSPNLWGLEFLKGRDYYITCKSGWGHTHAWVKPSLSLGCNVLESSGQRHRLPIPTCGATFQYLLATVFSIPTQTERGGHRPPPLSLNLPFWIRLKTVASLSDCCRSNQHLSCERCMR